MLLILSLSSSVFALKDFSLFGFHQNKLIKSSMKSDAFECNISDEDFSKILYALSFEKYLQLEAALDYTVSIDWRDYIKTYKEKTGKDLQLVIAYPYREYKCNLNIKGNNFIARIEDSVLTNAFGKDAWLIEAFDGNKYFLYENKTKTGEIGRSEIRTTCPMFCDFIAKRIDFQTVQKHWRAYLDMISSKEARASAKIELVNNIYTLSFQRKRTFKDWWNGTPREPIRMKFESVDGELRLSKVEFFHFPNYIIEEASYKEVIFSDYRKFESFAFSIPFLIEVNDYEITYFESIGDSIGDKRINFERALACKSKIKIDNLSSKRKNNNIFSIPQGTRLYDINSKNEFNLKNNLSAEDIFKKAFKQ